MDIRSFDYYFSFLETTINLDALGNVTNYEYDDFNRLQKTIYPAAATGAVRLQESVTYDTLGNVKTKTDTAGRVTNYDYDTAQRLTKTIDALNEMTQFEYNNRSQMTKVTDAANQVYQFSYDALGRQLSQTRAGSTMSYEYDAVGSRTKRIDYLGRQTNYEYDALNRLKKITYLTGADNTVIGNVTNYNYDDLSRLTSAINEAGTVAFTYDTRGRVKTTTDVFGHLLNYGYDANGNRNLLKLDSNVQTAYAYDAANRLTTLTDEANQNFTFGYDVANRLISKAMPNGIATSYDYDGMSRLTRLKNQSPSATLTDNNYGYNTASQISSIAELSQTKNYSYDNVDRLTGMTGGTGNENYTFDNVGNRTSSQLSSSYNYQPFNKLANTSTANYSYDKNGNLISKSEGKNFWRYVWDGENRMSSASTRKQTIRYRYDALGRRVQRYFIRGGSENTKFIYDGMDVVADDNNGVLTKYQNGLGIDDKLKVSINGTAKYFITDHLGSTVGLINSSGATSEQTVYDSFGNATNSLSTRYQFTGREYDSFTGLNYYRARWYDSKTGRFISEDPIGFKGGQMNFYGYVRNNPQNFKDPRGLDIVVIENGATSGNPIGHTAIGISNIGVITFGNANPYVPGINGIGGRLGDYLNRESPKRNTGMWIIHTSPEQDAAAFNKALEIGYFRPPLEGGTIALDNCSLRSNEILDAAGIPNNNWFLPDTFPGTAGSRAADYGGDYYYVPQGDTANIIPVFSPDYNWKNFEPKKKSYEN